MIRAVRGHDDPVILVSQIPYAPEHRRLIAQIEGGGRLIHHQDPPVLDQRPGNEGHLLLAPGELGEGARGQVGDSQSCQHLLGAPAVLPGGGVEQTQT